jgi:uncharacterized protein (DUF1800 family)
MGNVNRREFLEELIATQTAHQIPPSEDTVYKKYANKQLPGGLAKTTSALSQYSGPWTETQVRHLIRRTMFGVKDADVQTLLAMTMSQAVDHLLNNIPAAPAPPVNDYNTSTYTDPTGVAAGATWVNAAAFDGTLNSKRRGSYKAWWFSQMAKQNLSIQEKMVFFWHNHFSTQTTTVGDPRYCYLHNVLLRNNALGNFKDFVNRVTIDPAMLIYLSGYQNTKTNPDENYGRELQELFTVSKYNNPNYIEADVQAAAKVLTGWQVSGTTISSSFNSTRHDTTNKQFSSFYANTVINGVAGANGGTTEISELVNMILAKTETANYIASKLYIFFLYYNIDSTITTNIVHPLAQVMIANNYDIKPVLSALLKSDHFYDTNNMGCYIRTPLDFLVGTWRTFNVTLPANFTVVQQYDIWNYLRGMGATMGLDLGDPPNVSGWAPFYQLPEYYEIWINSSTLPTREKFTDLMLSTGFSAGSGTAINIKILPFIQAYPNASDPDQLVTYLTGLLLGMDVDTTEHNNLTSILLSGQTNPSYWSSAWLAYVANPNTANTSIVQTRLASMLTVLLRLPEYQLC